jgi:hypothetical protein
MVNLLWLLMGWYRPGPQAAGGILDVVIEMLERYDTDPGELGGSRVKYVDTHVVYRWMDR